MVRPPLPLAGSGLSDVPGARAAGTASSAPFIGRTTELTTLREVLHRPASGGAVLVGAAGAGKSALLHHLQQGLTDSQVIQVRGLRAASTTPYRALSFLLSELPADVTHPALVFNAVSAYLRSLAQGRGVVFAVDNVDLLDGASATLIAHLVATEQAQVLLTATDFARVDPAFSALWRSGRLKHLELPALSFEEIRELAEAELRAPLSRECLEEIWAAGSGNPQATLTELRGLVREGFLVHRGSSWVLLGPGSGMGMTVGGSSLFPELPATQQRAVRFVALLHSVPWCYLAQLVCPRDIDDLEAAGILTVGQGMHPQVALAQPRLARAVVDTLTAEEAGELYARAIEVPVVRDHLRISTVDRVRWRLRAGLPVAEAEVVGAVTALNDDAEYAAAAQLVRDASRSLSPSLALQGLIATLGQAHVEEAGEYAGVLAAADAGMDPALWVHYRMWQSVLLRGRAAPDAGILLEAAAEQVSAWQREVAGTGSEREFADLARSVMAAQADLASFEGRYSENLAALRARVVEVLPTSATRSEREFQVMVQSFVLEAQVAMDQTGVSVGIVAALTRNLSHPEVSFRVADAALQRVEVAFLVSGGWSEGAWLLQELSRSSSRWSLRRGSLAELADGMDLLGQDHLQEAAKVLGPVVEQLRIADPQGFLPVAAAGLTLCHARLSTGDGTANGAVEGTLNGVADGAVNGTVRGAVVGTAGTTREGTMAHLPFSEAGRWSSWMVRRAARHLQLLSSVRSEARTGTRKETARRLQERAPQDLAQGATQWALTTLAAAVRLGRSDAVPELHELAGTLHGEGARICRRYAEALLTGDRDLLLDAMTQAAEAGDERFARDIAESGIRTATQADDRAGLRLIQRKLREVLPESAQQVEGSAGIELLTPREREIAVLAALGTSNRIIAQKFFVSVRTVEGHLYQVYAKLGVGTRAELADVIPAEPGP